MAKRKTTPQKHPLRNAIILLLIIGIALVFAFVTGSVPPEILKLLPPNVQEIVKLLIPKSAPTPVPQTIPTPLPPVLSTPIPAPSEDWWQVYFSDPNTMGKPDDPAHTIPPGSIEEKLIARIAQTTQSIHIASFEFNLTPVAVALIEAHKRGVEVQWVIST